MCKKVTGYHLYKNVDGVNMAIMSFGEWLVRRDLFYWISNRHKGEFFLYGFLNC